MGCKYTLKALPVVMRWMGLALITLKTWESGIIAFSLTIALKATGTQGAFPY